MLMGNEKGGWLNKSGIVKKNKQWNFDENLKKSTIGMIEVTRLKKTTVKKKNH